MIANGVEGRAQIRVRNVFSLIGYSERHSRYIYNPLKVKPARLVRTMLGRSFITLRI